MSSAGGIRARALTCLFVGVLATATACSGGSTPSVADPAPAAVPTTTASATPTPASTSPAAPEAAPAVSTSAGPRTSQPPSRSGRMPVVALDPGHNGGNAAHPQTINQLVDAGFGQRKACNTVGASTASGYPEHAFNWDVAIRVRALLSARGVRVLLTRADDAGVGPCVDVRGRFGQQVRADAVVSIHADGAPVSGRGFHVIQAARAPAGTSAAENTRLALALRGRMLAGSGFGYATYLAGGDGLDERTDLAGLNLSTRPTAMIECGNMRNAADAARMTSAAGRARVAAAIAAGILDFLR